MFNVLALGEFIKEEGIDIALRAFAELYHTVTIKHQRKMNLVMITKGIKIESIQEKTKELNIEEKVELVNWSDQEKIELCYKNASIMLLPSNENLSKLISESLSFGLPVISYDNDFNTEVIDNTCGMLIDEKNIGENVLAFSNMLRILYFDPEARKILKKGAMNKYKEAFSWGFDEDKTRKSLAAY